jgi:hypothetical protein
MSANIEAFLERGNSFLEKLGKFGAAVVAIVSTVYGGLAYLLSGFAPAWPHPLVPLGVVVVAVIALFVLAAITWNRPSFLLRLSGKQVKTTGLLAGISVVVYLYLWGMYVVTYPSAPDDQFVIGFSLQEHYEKWVNENPMTDADLLDKWNRQPDAAWTKSSIVIVQLLLLVTWTLAWWLPTIVLSYLLALWRDSPPRSKAL